MNRHLSSLLKSMENGKQFWKSRDTRHTHSYSTCTWHTRCKKCDYICNYVIRMIRIAGEFLFRSKLWKGERKRVKGRTFHIQYNFHVKRFHPLLTLTQFTKIELVKLVDSLKQKVNSNSMQFRPKYLYLTTRIPFCFPYNQNLLWHTSQKFWVQFSVSEIARETIYEKEISYVCCISLTNIILCYALHHIDVFDKSIFRMESGSCYYYNT